jgi:hypothetical protein
MSSDFSALSERESAQRKETGLPRPRYSPDKRQEKSLEVKQN